MSERREHLLYRALEIVPGASVWVALALATFLSFADPVSAIVFILLFDLFWCFRVSNFVVYLLLSWRRYRRVSRTDWLAKLSGIPGEDELLHVVMLPTYTEEMFVIRETLKSLSSVAYPKDRMVVLLAGEERDRERFEANAEAVRKEFSGVFRELIFTVHPKGLPGEIPGKGSNMNWAGQRLKEWLDERGIGYRKTLVSAFDVDTIVHPQYFAYLSWLYLTSPDPTHASYQPIALYSNNIWDSPAPVRVAVFGTTFWIMSELARRDHTVTFSSHSMTMQALVDVDFWEKDVVSEDSRIFLQCLRRYHGDYRVVPMYLPVSMDTVGVGGYVESMSKLYRQVRRWAWGVEHFPYLCRHFATDRETPLLLRIKFVWREWEGRFSWATAPIIMFMMGQLPLWVASSHTHEPALVTQAPFALEWLMRFAMIGVLTSALISFTLLPPPPEHRPRWHGAFMVLQWLLIPITFVVFGSIPAIDAQTRLMLGKYLGFNVSAKRKGQNS